MKAKHSSGTINPAAIPETSAIRPIITGHIAPPTIVITSTEDPFLVIPPRSFNPNAKIVGNIMYIQK